MEIPWYANAAGNFFAGITLSFGDRLLSKNASRFKESRIEKKLNVVTSMKYLADSNAQDNGSEYLGHIERVREYFRENGALREKKESLTERFADRVNHYKNEERLNNLSAGKKLGAAFGIELFADLGVTVAQVSGGSVSAVTALGHTLYQGPAMFLGLVTGKGLLYVKDALFKDKNEKELDQLTKELTADGKILSIVKDYSSTARLKYEAPKEIPAEIVEEPSAETETPKKIGTGASEKMDSLVEKLRTKVTAIGQDRREKKQRELDEEAARKKLLQDKLDRY